VQTQARTASTVAAAGTFPPGAAAQLTASGTGLRIRTTTWASAWLSL